MAVLSDSLTLKVLTGTVVAATVSLGGCMLASHIFSGEPRFAFSHRAHIEEEGLDCFGCHEFAMMADDPGMPEMDSCQVCHEDLDTDKPLDRRVEGLFADGQFQAAHISALGEELIFSHKLHANGDQQCADCHRGIATNEAVGPGLEIAMDACTGCHLERAAPNDCSSCHREIRKEWPPDSHAHNWERAHGRLSRAGYGRAANDCQLCHTEETCSSCHLDEPPTSHNNHFRRRGHGIIARMDRRNCAVCHRTDSCDQCHSEVRPMNHSGMWGGVVNNHCITCHLPLRTEACVTCHKALPDHLSTPKPPGHNPLMDCRQCHGVTQPLPHVDKGDDCNLCHL